MKILEKKKSNKKSQYKLITAILLFGFFTGLSTQSTHNINSSHLKDKIFTKKMLISPNIASVVLETIFINGSDPNNDWLDSLYVSEGVGSEISPYVIKDLVIDVQGNGSGMEIINSDAHVVIQNCSITNTGENIETAGIKLEYSSNITINNCTIFNNGNYGINIDIGNQNNTISNNHIHNNRIGISLSSSNTTINNNNISKNIEMGIDIQIANHNILNNNISDNGNYGIYGLNVIDNMIISNNSFSKHIIDDIFIYILSNSQITDNNFTSGGIYIISGNNLDFDQSNLLNNKPIHYYEDKNNLIIDGKNIGQLILINCSYSTFDNLEISDTNIGIYLTQSTNITFNNNQIINTSNDGIRIVESPNTTLYSNIINNSGIRLVSTSEFFIDESNLINGKFFKYFQNENNLVLNGNIDNIGQLVLKNCNNAIIENFCISNTSYGLEIIDSDYIELRNNTFSNNNEWGIKMDNSDHIIIENNSVINNGDVGINLYNCLNFSIIENTIQSNKLDGISLAGVNISIIENNKIEKCGQNGILLNGAHNNSIYNNNISNCEMRGMMIFDSDLNIIENNSILNSGTYGSYFTSSNNNTFSKNFIQFSGEDGIYMMTSEFNQLTNNTIRQSIKNGFQLYHSFNSTIANNIIIENGNYGLCSNISDGNEFNHNFYSRNNDWSELLQTYDNGVDNLWTNTEFLEGLRDDDTDTLTTFDELFNYYTDPNLLDTDYDFYPDNIEVLYGTDPNNPNIKPVITNRYWQNVSSNRNIIECIDENGKVLFDVIATLSSSTNVKLYCDTNLSDFMLEEWITDLNLEFDYYYAIDFEDNTTIMDTTTASFYFPEDGTIISDYQLFQLDLITGEWKNVSKSDVLISENQRKLLIYNITPDAVFGIGIDPNHVYLPGNTPNPLPFGIPGYNMLFSTIFTCLGITLIIKRYNKEN